MTLLNGDCVPIMQMCIPDESVDLVVTSPPYDNLRQYNGIADAWDFDKFKSVASELFRVTKSGGVVVWIVNDATVNGSETGSSFKQALYFKEIGFRLHDTMIYEKINYIPQNHNRYEQCFEFMFVLSKGKPETFNAIRVPCKNPGKVESYGAGRRSLLDKNQAMRAPDGIEYKPTKADKPHSNIFRYACGVGEKTGHPAVFPEKLAEDHILSWSNEGDVVMDPFMGSGTTGKMCLKNNREFIGIEMDEGYFTKAKERLEKYET